MKRRFKKKELEAFRISLVKRRNDLTGTFTQLGLEALTQAKGQNGDLSTIPSHLADHGTENFNQDFALGIMETESLSLDEIDRALERIRDGSFGVCEACGKPIPKSRLRARPQAALCVQCKEREELGLF